ncbi:2-phosphoglycerate kinase [Paenibacillus sp. BC26]|uniref:2-phosphoglycerate kinase n=1 Tax=Paenibacillus sp. BC26 TaxID=1881032 RepID=UPI0008E3BE2B|nr:2-phosphoglycerate kinase [Paenibacillus sp. BC26]SFS60393.1 putative acetyltransferase [Paenibacillus sp. BC26]
MIILISGSSRTGKTLMAQTLLENYHIPYLSIDHLKMGLYRANPECGFTPLDSTEHIGETLWPILKGIIMTNIENKQNLIIEGCYILPEYIHDFEEEYAEKIVSVFLGFSRAYIDNSLVSHIFGHQSVIEDRGDPEEEHFISEYRSEHDAFRSQCLGSGAAYFEINENYENEIVKVYDYIASQIQAKTAGSQ